MTDLAEPVRAVDSKPEIVSEALQSIRSFLRETTCYQILPESFRLIVLDNQLTIKRALTAMTVNSLLLFSDDRKAGSLLLENRRS